MKSIYSSFLKLFVVLVISSIKFVYAIYNGTPEPDSHKYPFMVSIQIQENGTWTHWCGGSFISPTMILTAGHCVADSNGDPYPANMAQIVTRDGSILKAESFHVNPNFYWQAISGFDNSIAENDLAVIELSTTVKNASIVNLPSLKDANEYYAPNNLVMAIGYGVYDMMCSSIDPQYCNVSYPLLRSAELNILSNDQIKWADVNGISYSNANQYFYPTLFIGAYSNIQSPTAHDSGSPLLVKDKNDNYIIIATFSAGVSTPQLFQINIYTRLDTYDNLSWISSFIKMVENDRLK